MKTESRKTYLFLLFSSALCGYDNISCYISSSVSMKKSGFPVQEKEDGDVKAGY